MYEKRLGGIELCGVRWLVKVDTPERSLLCVELLLPNLFRRASIS